jgi:hypothetical protein
MALANDYQVWIASADNATMGVTVEVPGVRHFSADVSAGKYYLIHRTFCTVADNPDTERTDLGVAEKVTCKFVGAYDKNEIPAANILASWSGGNVSPLVGPWTVYTASLNNEGQIIKGAYRGAELKVYFNITQPTGINVTERSRDTFGLGNIGAGAEFNVVLQPTTVSFGNLQVIEPHENTIGNEGIYSQAPPQHRDWGAGVPTDVGCNNVIGGPAFGNKFDHAQWFEGLSMLGSWGNFTWPIHAKWMKKGSGTVSGDVPGWTSQEMSLETSGTMTVKKFGKTITRPRSDP